MHNLKKLIKHLNELYQADLFKDFCPNGLQVEASDTIKKAATAVSASLETIQKAAKLKVQVLIVHHGLFWNYDSHVISGAKAEKIKILIENGISLLAYHLPMDAHKTIGNNWKAAMDLGWESLEPFYAINGMAIGVKGKTGELSREGFQKKIEKYYAHKAEVAFGGKNKIQTAALVSGGAYKQIKEAAAEEIDAFITGNFDEPAWHYAFEEKINFYALGHAATERVGPKALADTIRQSLKLDCRFIDDNNPF